MTEKEEGELILNTMEEVCGGLTGITSTKSVVAGLIVTLARYIDGCADNDADYEGKLDNVVETLRQASAEVRAGRKAQHGD